MLTTPLPSDLLVPIFRDARDMLLLTWAGVRAPSGAALDTAAALGCGIHKIEKELTERLVAGSDEAAPLRLVPAHVERIADAIDGLVRACQLMEAEGTTFTARGMREVNALFERAAELLECAGDLTLTGNRVLARHVEVESMRFQDLATEYARAHEERMVEGVCRPASSSAYLGILDYLREITRHSRLIARRIAPRPAPGEGPLFRTLGAALLACILSLGAGAAHAERSTISGNAGTITLDWQATQDKAGRPLIVGHMITNGGKSGYCIPCLLVETLDAQGKVVAQNVGFIPGYVGGYDNVYFEEPIRAPGAGYRVSIPSWNNCGGGQ